MNISDQLREISGLFADNELIPVMEQMAGALMPDIVVDCIPDA